MNKSQRLTNLIKNLHILNKSCEYIFLYTLLFIKVELLKNGNIFCKY